MRADSWGESWERFVGIINQCLRNPMGRALLDEENLSTLSKESPSLTLSYCKKTSHPDTPGEERARIEEVLVATSTSVLVCNVLMDAASPDLYSWLSPLRLTKVGRILHV
ncbi:hypothetical protein TNCV_3656271 [Trichonephila clavipes]|nr:hypothetical protein TNCV_3656271 [Trichonephila clavipes]